MGSHCGKSPFCFSKCKDEIQIENIDVIIINIFI